MIRYATDRWLVPGEQRFIVAVGLSTDEKPTQHLITGSKFEEVDTGRRYEFDEETGGWILIRAGFEGSANREIAYAIKGLGMSPAVNRVSSLDQTQIACASIVGGILVQALGIPAYVDDVTAQAVAAYNLTDTGWYVFLRLEAPDGESASAETVVTGAAGSVITVGETHVDVAVRFEVAAMGAAVTVVWGETSDLLVVTATDLAVRNLDYRTTFYVYDLAPFCTWQYALTTDETFQEGKAYYTEDDGVYTLATVTAGEAIPADTYYNHSKLIISGMTRNITYRLDAIIDCPQEVVLPDVEDDTHGCWFEFQLRHSGSFSMTLTVPEGVKIATEHTQAESAGFNLIDLHYMKIDEVEMWRFMNTHSSIPTT